MIFGAILGSPNRSKLSWNLIKKDAPSWIDNLSLVEASGGAFGLDFGLDFGLILGSIWGSRAPYAIFAEIGTAPQREHDFRGSGGVKKEPQMAPKAAVSDNLAPRATWEPLGLDFGSFWGPF